jgi:aryl-alcohol dehydrogenase-like predicted oxidoreductase
MDYRTLGRTQLQVSALSFGCGAVGGVLVKGERRERVRAVGRAIDLGVNYFDTAAIYGDGKSEENLGAALQELDAQVIVGTKVRLQPEQMADIERAVIASVDNSLRRLRRGFVDLIQLHNYVGVARRANRQWVSPADVAAVTATFRKLREQGKVRYWGFNGLGDPAAVHQALLGNVQTVQACFNLLNPTAGMTAPPGFPFEDYGRLIDVAAEKAVGVIAIRALAGGALSGSALRHVNATPTVDPIASGKSFAEDVALAQRFRYLIDEGYAESLVEAAVRFVVGNAKVSTTAIGISSIEQLEQLARYVANGALPVEALERLCAIW